MFRINGEIWQVYYVSPNDFNLRRSNNSFALGVCDDNKKAIYISNNLNSAKTKEVLCHEIAHSAMFSYNIDLDIEQEELFVSLIATFGEEIVDITDSIFAELKRKRENR